MKNCELWQFWEINKNINCKLWRGYDAEIRLHATVGESDDWEKWSNHRQTAQWDREWLPDVSDLSGMYPTAQGLALPTQVRLQPPSLASWHNIPNVHYPLLVRLVFLFSDFFWPLSANGYSVFILSYLRVRGHKFDHQFPIPEDKVYFMMKTIRFWCRLVGGFL